jgi:CRISPR-associated protein (TIGR03986 family)
MNYLPSPYNFVPLNPNIWWHPDAGHIRHDVPFRDGLSGWIKVELEAKTPIYVRAAGQHDGKAIRKDLTRFHEDLEKQGSAAADAGLPLLEYVKKHEKELWDRLQKWSDFYRLPNGAAALPDTTVKGMLRNVTEIVTYGRLWRIGEDKRYSVRDLGPKDSTQYKKWMTQTVRQGNDRIFVPKPRAAWLYLGHQHEWRLQPCQYARVEHRSSRTGPLLGNLSTLMQSVPGGDTGWTFQGEASAVKTYANWIAQAKKRGVNEGCELDVGCTFDPPATSGGAPAWPVGDHGSHANGKLRFRKVVKLWFDKNGPYTLVFTGCPTPQKHREFVFQCFRGLKDADPRVPGNDTGDGQPGVREDFLFIHAESKEWKKRWSEELSNHRPVPVFYLAFDSPNPDVSSKPVVFTGNNTLHSMGLSLMYKLAYRHPVGGALPSAHREPTGTAVADALFGYVDKAGALRGRVNCEGFVLSGDERQETTILAAILGSPKPTFYPNYLEQERDQEEPDRLRRTGDEDYRGNPVRVHYQTFMSVAPRVRGRKRYVIRADLKQPVENQPDGRKPDQMTYFRPLQTGARFQGRVHFHNLRPWELGAVLWALCWGEPAEAQPGKEPRYWHSVGMAKPLGCGAVAARILDLAAVDCQNHEQPRLADIPEQARLIDLFLEKIGSFPGIPNAGDTAAASERARRFRELPEIKELLAMADSQRKTPPEWLRYPGPGVKAFAEAKENEFVLRPFSDFPVNKPQGP